MACIPNPLCIECGNLDNPRHCKIVGPTLAFRGLCVAALVEWPVGAVIQCCDCKAGTLTLIAFCWALPPYGQGLAHWIQLLEVLSF
jgi:hypothetical protein